MHWIGWRRARQRLGSPLGMQKRGPGICSFSKQADDWKVKAAFLSFTSPFFLQLCSFLFLLSFLSFLRFCVSFSFLLYCSFLALWLFLVRLFAWVLSRVSPLFVLLCLLVCLCSVRVFSVASVCLPLHLGSLLCGLWFVVASLPPSVVPCGVLAQ